MDQNRAISKINVDPAQAARLAFLAQGDELDGAAAHGVTPIQLSFPTTGANSFVNRITGDTYREVLGVVAVSRMGRAFYVGEFTTGNDRPVCSSSDAVRGSNPQVCQSLQCVECPQDRWGTGANGQGKACKELRRLVVVSRREEPPFIMTIPVTSMRTWDNYCTALRANGKRYYSVITRLSLVQGQTAGGRPIVKLQTESLKDLNDEQLRWILEERERCLPLVVRSSIVDDDNYEEGEGDVDTPQYVPGEFDPAKRQDESVQTTPQTAPRPPSQPTPSQHVPRQAPSRQMPRHASPTLAAPPPEFDVPPVNAEIDIPF